MDKKPNKQTNWNIQQTYFKVYTSKLSEEREKIHRKILKCDFFVLVERQEAFPEVLFDVSHEREKTCFAM